MENKEQTGGKNEGAGHYHMDKAYERNSQSQQTIGALMIENAVEVSAAKFRESGKISVLDLACGPGNLTAELRRKLADGLPNTEINLVGMDYTQANVNLLNEKYGAEIKGIVGSFYDSQAVPADSIDMITSNEGLHWQPPYEEMTEIIYRKLPPEERAKYEEWALNNFKLAMRNIHTFLKESGVAVLQFGHEGQLDKLWDLVSEILNSPEFIQFKDKVHFPLFYPKVEDINSALIEAGFSPDKIDINTFNQDLTEDSSEAIANFFAAFTRPGFSQFFDPAKLNEFYKKIKEGVERVGVAEFRKDQWHRTLIRAER